MNSNSDDAIALLFGGAFALIYILALVIALVACVIMIIAMWKIFAKAGEPGWAAIIPFYNIWVLAKITTNNNILWFILALIGVSAPVAMIVMYLGLGKSFGKGMGYGVFCILLPIVAVPMLAFGSAEYTGDKL